MTEYIPEIRQLQGISPYTHFLVDSTLSYGYILYINTEGYEMKEHKFSAKPWFHPHPFGPKSKPTWFVNRLFWDIDHWHKYSHYPFSTKQAALDFIAEKRSEGRVF